MFLPLLFACVVGGRLSRRVRGTTAAAVHQQSLCVPDRFQKIRISAIVTLISPWELPYLTTLTLLDLHPSPQLCRHFGHHVSLRPSP